MENKTRILDSGLIVGGGIWAYLQDIPVNILVAIVEQPIESILGLCVIGLTLVRTIRVIQKLFQRKQ